MKNTYRRDCLLGVLSGALMLVGDLCLSVIPASAGDSGLFLREAFLSGSYPAWRLPLLLGTGVLGMALSYFTVRTARAQIRPECRRLRWLITVSGAVYVSSAGVIHLLIGSLADWTSTLGPILGREETAALALGQYQRLTAALILSRGWFSFSVLVVGCLIIGSINSIYMVAYQSFYPMLITPGNYSKAYSIASVLETLSAVMIPVATFAYNKVGITPLLAANAVCFLVAAIAETQIKAEESQILGAQQRTAAPAARPAAAAPSASASGSSSANTLPAFNSSDNFPLLSSACAVVRAIQERDYDTLAAFVHPEEGVTFTPYSTVDRDSDLRFTAAQVRQFSTDQTVYTWGVSDGLGSLIELTPAEYFSTYVFNTDYTQAPEIGVDRILQSGNALENLTEAYPGCRFVEFHFPGLDPANAGLDWCSLKLVFSPSDSCWQLVGIIHSQWTI